MPERQVAFEILSRPPLDGCESIYNSKWPILMLGVDNYQSLVLPATNFLQERALLAVFLKQ